MILLPNGLPSKLQQETLSREEINTVLQFEAWCRNRGLSFILNCDKCLMEHGTKKGYCTAGNDRYSSSYHIVCNHADRIHGNIVSH
jgi:hypothetical protein